MTSPAEPSPTKKPNSGLWGRAVIVGLLLMCGACSVFGGSDKSTDEPTDGAAFVACKDFVKDRLKAPSTADFGSIIDTDIAHTGPVWTVSGPVDAENSFGAKLRLDYTCMIRANGDTWTLESITGLG